MNTIEATANRLLAQRIAARQAELTALEHSMMACKCTIESERKRHRELANRYNSKLWSFDHLLSDDNIQKGGKS